LIATISAACPEELDEEELDEDELLELELLELELLEELLEELLDELELELLVDWPQAPRLVQEASLPGTVVVYQLA
jgi:hypothetical protein